LASSIDALNRKHGTLELPSVEAFGANFRVSQLRCKRVPHAVNHFFSNVQKPLPFGDCSHLCGLMCTGRSPVMKFSFIMPAVARHRRQIPLERASAANSFAGKTTVTVECGEKNHASPWCNASLKRFRTVAAFGTGFAKSLLHHDA